MAKKIEDTRSNAIQLLDLVWQNTNSATGFSYERLNHAMQAALSLAIGAGFEFHEDDMDYIWTHYNSHYWLGASPEWVYTEAIGVENNSAIKSFEKLFKRDPIIADEVDGSTRSHFMHGEFACRAKCRLFVGARFRWKGVMVTVTSFADDSSYCTACSYKPREKGSYENKVDKRFKITRDAVIADRAERKKTSKTKGE